MRCRIPVSAVSVLLLAELLFVASGCRAQRDSALRHYDLDKRSRHITLAKHLREISGLTITPQGHLYAHDDERGAVYRLDPMTGSVLAVFLLGRTMVTEDFEGIAATGKRMYMVTSRGEIFEFNEAGDGKRVEYRVHRTPLSRDNDVEGLCYDPATNALLLACKGDPGKGYRGSRTVYSFSLKTNTLDTKPRFVLDEKRLSHETRGGEFHPSAIERHPRTGTFFILAAHGESLVEVSPKGRILAQVKLPKGKHPQAEGITFLSNGDMLISDEGKKHGSLTRYSWK